jgi:hypothetical protein
MTNQNEVDGLPKEQLGRYFDEHRKDDSLWKRKGRRVKKPRGEQNRTAVFQLRLSPDELEEISSAAGGNVSDFVRTAALDRARNRTLYDGETAQIIENARIELTERLAEIVHQLAAKASDSNYHRPSEAAEG